MIYIAILILLVLAFTVWKAFDTIKTMQESAQNERRELEDRLLALTRPESLAGVEAVRDRRPGTVSYVDEEFEEDRVEASLKEMP